MPKILKVATEHIRQYGVKCQNCKSVIGFMQDEVDWHTFHRYYGADTYFGLFCPNCKQLIEVDRNYKTTYKSTKV